MSEKIREKKGCGWWCMVFLGICLAVAVFPFVAGVALWLLIRYVWRRLCIEAPSCRVVKSGLKMPPIVRKVTAGLLCAMLSLALFGALMAPQEGSDAPNTPIAQGQASSSSTEAKNDNADKSGSSTSDKEGHSKDEEKPRTSGRLGVKFIDVGQGDSALVKLPGGKVMLMDTGEASASDAVLSALHAEGIETIDYLVISHPHSDHMGGAEAVLDAFDVTDVYVPDAPAATDTFASFLDAVQREGAKTHVAADGEKIADGDKGCQIDFLAPSLNVESDDMNDYSAIVRIKFGDISFLFTGDASSRRIVDADPGDIDVLKASHHGSETGTDGSVLSSCKPEYAVLSYGEGNSYGHPDQAVLDALTSAGVNVYSTAANGNITFESDGNTVTVETQKEGQAHAGVLPSSAPAPEETTQPSPAPEQEQMVVVTPTGKKYHRPGCRTLNRSRNTTEVSKSSAEASGLLPCGVCNP